MDQKGVGRLASLLMDWDIRRLSTGIRLPVFKPVNFVVSISALVSSPAQTEFCCVFSPVFLDLLRPDKKEWHFLASLLT